jgi:hypothetical protein
MRPIVENFLDHGPEKAAVTPASVCWNKELCMRRPHWMNCLSRLMLPRRRRGCQVGSPDLLEPRRVLSVTAQTDLVIANGYTNGAQTRASSAVDGSGNLIVVWQDSELDGNGSGIYARKVSPAGVPLADQYRLNTTTAGNQTGPEIVPINNGFVVLWVDVNSSVQVMFQRLDSTGAKVGPEVNATATFDPNLTPLYPRVFSLADGGFAVLWLAEPIGDGVFNVAGRRYNATGTQTGTLSASITAFDSNAFERLGNVVGADFPQIGLALASDGTLLVYWNKISEPFVPDVGQRYSSTVQVQRFSLDGSSIGAVGTLLDFNLSNDFDVQRITPLITPLAGGDFLLQWHAPDDFRWTAQRFNSSYAPQGAGFTLIDASESDGGFLIGAARSKPLSNGDVLVSWHRSIAFNNDQSKIRLFTPNGTPKSSVLLVTDRLERGEFVEITPDSNRGFWVATWDVANPSSGVGESDVYIRRYQTDDAPENRAPVLLAGSNPYIIAPVGRRLSTELERGVLISDLLATGPGGQTFTDADGSANRGIAIYYAFTEAGTWQYTTAVSPVSTDWIDLPAGSGPTLDSAFLLAADTTTRIRLVSSLVPHHDGTTDSGFLPVDYSIPSALEFVAWDRSTGTNGGRANITSRGGVTAFSTDTQEIDLYFEARLFRHFNRNAALNVYTLEAEFNAIAAGNSPAFEDRSTDAWIGFTVLLSNVPGLNTTPLYRMYYGVQFNANGTEIDMGYRYLTSNVAEAFILEESGPADKRSQRAGAYFREIGVTFGTGILGYIYTTQQPGTQQMRQIYRTDIVQKPTRPPGTSEGGTPTSFTPQENGDHVYTTNTAFETSKPGTWRIEDPRGFVRPLGASGIIAPATPAQTSMDPVARSATTSSASPTGSTFATFFVTSLDAAAATLTTLGITATVDVRLIASPNQLAPSLPWIVRPTEPETTTPVALANSQPDDETSAIDEFFSDPGIAADDLRDLCSW